MAEVGTAWVNVVPSAKGFGKAASKQIAPQMGAVGSTAGRSFGEAFTRDANGRLRDSRGRYASAGSAAGNAFGETFTRDANGRLRDSMGRFVAEGRAAGEQGGSSAGSSFGARFTERLQSGLGKVGDILSKVVGGAALTAGAVGAAALGKALTGGVTRLLNLEDAEKRLETMGVGIADTEALMAGLNKVLEGTPYALDAGATAMSNLVSAGFELEEIPGILEMVTDAAAFGQADFTEIARVFQRIGTNGRLTAMELEMLGDRGIPALSLLSDAAGVTADEFRGMIRNNEVDAETFFTLWEQGAQGFGENNVQMAGAAKSAGDTTRGAWANLQTALSRFGAKVLEPLMGEVADLFRSLTDWIDVAGGAWQDWVGSLDFDWGSLTSGASEAGETLAEVFTPLTDAVSEIDFGKLWGQITDGVEGIREAFTSIDWAGVWERVGPMIENVVDAFTDLGKALWDVVQTLWPSLVDLGKALWPILKVVGVVVAAVGYAFHKYFILQLRVVAAVLRVVASAFSWWIDTVMVPGYNLLTTVVSWAWNSVILPVFRALSGFVQTTLMPIFRMLWNVAQMVWAGIGAAIQVAWMLIQPILTGIWNVISTVLVPIFQALWDRAREVWDGVWSAIQTAWNLISPIFETFREAIAGVADWVSEKVEAITGFFEDLPGKIGDAFSTLADAIKAPFETAFAAIKSLWNSTVGGFGFSVPSWVPGVGGKSFDIPTMHTGGVVGGRAGQEVFAVLQAGEVVLSRPQVAAAHRSLRTSSYGPAGGAGEAVTLTVPVVINGREFARATVDDLAVEANRQRKFTR